MVDKFEFTPEVKKMVDEMYGPDVEEDIEICPGNSTPICLRCGKTYSCYACPDTLNPSYTQGECYPCLHRFIIGDMPLEEGEET